MITKLSNLAPGMCFNPLNPYRVLQRGKVLAVNASEVKVELFDPEQGKKSRCVQGWAPAAVVQIVPESEFSGAKSQPKPYNEGDKVDKTTYQQEGEEDMTATAPAASPVTKTLAVKALQQITQRPDLNPTKMTVKVVQAKLDALKKVPPEELHEPEDPVLKDIFKDALSENGIKVVEDEGSEQTSTTEEKPKKGKGGKKAAKAESNGETSDPNPKPKGGKKGKGGKKESTPPANADKFGSVGNMALFNKGLSKKPKSLKDILKDSGAKVTYFQGDENKPNLSQFYKHLKTLIASGHVVRDGKLFAKKGE